MPNHGSGFPIIEDFTSTNGSDGIRLGKAFWFDGEKHRVSVVDVDTSEDKALPGKRVSRYRAEKSILDDDLFREVLLGKDVELRPYSRLGKEVEEPQWEDNWTEVGRLLTASMENKPDAKTIPAAYTYFGQFIAHDLSNIAGTTDNKGEVIAASAALDLSGLFGAECTHDMSPSVWCDGVGVGVTIPFSDGVFADLPRRFSGLSVIGDERNDHNLGVAQIHVLMSKFYHQVMLSAGVSETERANARNKARRLYQEAVLFDFLEKICDPDVHRDVLNNKRKVVQPGSLQADCPFQIPIEFSAACFRIGHSMIREEYLDWQLVGQNASLRDLQIFTFLGGDIYSSVPALQASWRVNWHNMLGDEAQPMNTRNFAKAVDHYVNTDLKNLDPRWLSESAAAHVKGEESNLATITLRRGVQYQLPSAQCLSRDCDVVGAKNPLLPILAPDTLIDPLVSHADDATGFLRFARKQGFAANTPIWLYCLLEARCRKDHRLGPFASRIIAETIHAAIESSGSGLIVSGKVVHPEKAAFSLHQIAKCAAEWNPNN